MIRKSLRIIGGILYLVMLLFSVVAFIKPGSAIFFTKYSLDPEKLVQQQNMITYELTVPESIYDYDSILVREGTKILARVKTEELKSGASGVFSVQDLGENEIIVRFILTTDIENGFHRSIYRILIRPYFVTSEWIFILFLFLTFGLVLFIVSIFVDPKTRKLVLSTPFGIMKLWANPIDFNQSLKSRFPLLMYSAINSVLFSFLYVFMEWLFFITKPSFMDILNMGDKLSIFITSGFGLSILVIILLFVLFALDVMFSFLFSPLHDFVYYLPEAFLLTALGLILLDNFTYTVLSFGVVSTSFILRGLYALAFIGAVIYLLRKFSLNYTQWLEKRPRSKWKSLCMASLLVISLIAVVKGFRPVHSNDLGSIQETDVKTQNIILLSNDGLNAANMSVYGYERETTPFLEELADTSLLMQNNFTNANASTGSDTAMLTGKLPFETGVLYPPNTLQGMDMYEHLPGLLKRYGYRTISLGVPHFVDVNVINFRNGFDSVNCKENQNSQIANLASQFGYSDSVYFISSIKDRFFDRFFYIFFIREMENPYAIVTETAIDTNQMSEEAILNCLRTNLEVAKRANQPLFAHVHLISTHGPVFHPELQKFSEDQAQEDNWMIDFYDDAILNFDLTVQDFVQYLKDSDLYNNTILVVYTDHASKWSAKEKIPLIIHFPQDQYVGEISANTQNLDIPTTVLDYMEIERPAWMDGSSLIGALERDRLIFAAEIKSSFVDAGSIVEETIKPPFYQFGLLDIIQCQNLFEIDLQNLTMMEYRIEGYYNPCPETMLAAPSTIWEAAGKMLSDLGYVLPENW